MITARTHKLKLWAMCHRQSSLPLQARSGTTGKVKDSARLRLASSLHFQTPRPGSNQNFEEPKYLTQQGLCLRPNLHSLKDKRGRNRNLEK
jgi:hypothetical protein